MRKRLGSKIYDTDTAVLVDTTPEGLQVYRKKNSPQFFLYNPEGRTAKEMFFELPPEQTERYLTEDPDLSTVVRKGSCNICFSAYDSARIKNLATRNGMSMSKFILMLVDEYEQKQS